MNDQLKTLYTSFCSDLDSSNSSQTLGELKVRYFGKSGFLTELLKSIGKLSPQDRPLFGQKVNQLRTELEALLASKESKSIEQEELQSIQNEKIDVTLPGRKIETGTLHPLTQIEQRLIQIFQSLGFSIEEGPDVETDYYNFESLNFPIDHPARDMQDTFFTTTGHVLRTHTSPVQIRTMEKCDPPLQIIVPGRVYRHDADTTHSPVFHQIEGLCVGEGIRFSDLKGVLETFIHSLFGSKTKTRFRPSFFPFTEPSAEMDVMGPHGKWMEILGCGMVDPKVFGFVNKARQEKGLSECYQTPKITGFAFGLGIERIAMIEYGIKDIRLFYENDIRFLKQF